MATAHVHLPNYVTSFVGRESELAHLDELLHPDSEYRLVTITGTGGCGKTRLAVQAAARVAANYPHEARIVDLAAHDDPQQVARAVAAALALQEGAFGSHEEALVNFLEERPLLLILDNCEHLIDAVASLASLLLRTSARLHILATSRELLRIAGELHFPLQPLPVPVLNSLPGPLADDADLANPPLYALMAYDSVRLFAARAAAVRPGFEVNHANAALIADICRRLDGLPLALELAAAQIRVFTPAELDERIANRVALHSWNRDVAPRHQTLDNVIEWSYRLLNDQERRLMRRLAFFGGGAALRCIEETCSSDDLPAGQVADLLRRLADKSLIQAVPQEDTTRFHMLETVRSYALLHLAPDTERAELRRRHATCYARITDAAACGLRSAQAVLWVRRLDSESENLRGAFGYWLEHDVALAARMVFNLTWYWVWRWANKEAAEWIHKVESALSALSPQPRADALSVAYINYTAALVAAWDMQLEPARDRLQVALDSARTTNNSALVAAISTYAALMACYAGPTDEAERIMQKFDRGELVHPDEWGVAHLLYVRAVLELVRGDDASAMAYLEESIRRFRAVGDPYIITIPLYELGKLAHAQRDFAHAAMLLEECRLSTTRLGVRNLMAYSRFRLAEVCQAMGQGSQALEHFNAALALLHSFGQEPTAHHLRFLAGMAADTGIWSLCVRLFTAADLSGAAGAPLPPNRIHDEQTLERARMALNGAEYAAARREGASLSVGDAILSALAEIERSLGGSEQVSAPALQLKILGPTEVLLNGRRLSQSDFKYSRSRDLLFYLICEGERTREQIGLALWPDANDKQLRERFNVTLHALRQALGSNNWVLYENNRYRFNKVAACFCDCDDFYHAISLADHFSKFRPEESLRWLKQATSLVRGDFLADVSHGEWHERLRVSVARDHLRALIRLGTLQIEYGQWAEALTTLSNAMRLDPYSEEVYRAIMLVHFHRRDRVQMIQVFRNLSELIAEEFGAPPSDETLELYESLLASLDGRPN